MGHRHSYSSSRLSDTENERSWNQPQPDRQPDRRLHLENGRFMLSVENPAVGENNSSFFNISPRSDNFSFSNFSLEALNYDAVTIGTSHGPCMNFSAGNSSQVPSQYVHHGQPCYNQFTVGNASGTINPQIGYGRVPFKRKRPTFYMPYENGSSNGYNAGSSSNIHASSDYLQPYPVAGSQCWVRGSTSTAPSFRNSLFLAGEGSQRNLRSLHSHVEFNPSGVHACSNLSRPSPVVAGEWNHTCIPLESHSTFSSGSSLSSSSIESIGAYHSNQMTNRSQNTPFPIHGHPIRGTGLGHNSHINRTSFRPTPSYRSMGFASASEISRHPVVEGFTPFRYPRPVSLGGYSGNRIGRGTFYGSPNLFDQHHDMRLDIDSMGYEELLALEERIGNVSTGLTENKISKYLKEVIYCSDQTLDEDGGNCCIICLEEYKEWDRLGGLRCGHDFHYCCIEKWLQIKNVCPICKASVAKDIDK